MSRTNKTPEQRFWEKVNVGAPDECWVWKASCYRHPYTKEPSYGKFKYYDVNTGAHRVSWMIHYGKIPEGRDVLHNCDNPKCVNPSHLRIGTKVDNMKDKHERGRANILHGSLHPESKLTEDQVREIKRLRKEGKYLVREIGDMFGVSGSIISNITLGKIWRHVE